LRRIWAQSGTAPADSAAGWRLFDGDGLPQGVLRLPARDAVLDADSSRVLLLRRDSLSVETVELDDFSAS
jgi:hypothetical protein